MATARRFEDLEVWKEARILVKEIYELTGKGLFSRDFKMRDQVRDAGLSVMSNIAEGFERGGNREFSQFLSTSKGSGGEVRSILYAALDQNYVSDEEFKRTHERVLRIS